MYLKETEKHSRSPPFMSRFEHSLSLSLQVLPFLVSSSCPSLHFFLARSQPDLQVLDRAYAPRDYSNGTVPCFEVKLPDKLHQRVRQRQEKGDGALTNVIQQLSLCDSQPLLISIVRSDRLRQKRLKMPLDVSMTFFGALRRPPAVSTAK